jgi:hypothetical protein
MIDRDPAVSAKLAPNLPVRLFDALERAWGGARTKRAIGTLLVSCFVASLVVIELRRLGLLPEGLASRVPTRHFYAVDVAFTLLLLLEVVSLIFSLSHSFSDSLGKQFEILSLILLRETFHGFKGFGEPIAWENVRGGLLPMVSDASGALAVFVLLGAFSRAQRHRPITLDEAEQREFVAAKKVIGLLLFLALFVLAAVDAHRLLVGLPTFSVFAGFYTVLIFSDVLIVLVSLRHSTTYAVFFRNSGFTVATVFIRLALAAAPPWNAALGVGSALFALALTHAYNRFLPPGPAPDRRDAGA